MSVRVQDRHVAKTLHTLYSIHRLQGVVAISMKLGVFLGVVVRNGEFFLNPQF